MGEDSKGGKATVIATDHVPHNYVPGMDVLASEEKFQKALKQRQDMMIERRFTPWARDNGFVQAGEAVVALPGCILNKLEPPPFPSSDFSLPPFAGGELVINNAGTAAVAVYRSEAANAKVEAQLRATIPTLKAVAFTTPHPLYIPHSDVYANFVSDGVLAVHAVSGPGNDASDMSKMHGLLLRASLEPLLRECGIKLLEVPHVAALPAAASAGAGSAGAGAGKAAKGGAGGSSSAAAKGGAGAGSAAKGTVGAAKPSPSTFASGRLEIRGNYVQFISTPHALYVPQYGGPYAEADARAMAVYKAALAAEGSGREAIGVLGRDPSTSGSDEGGGLHCLVTQLHGPPARKLLEALCGSIVVSKTGFDFNGYRPSYEGEEDEDEEDED